MVVYTLGAYLYVYTVCGTFMICCYWFVQILAASELSFWARASGMMKQALDGHSDLLWYLVKYRVECSTSDQGGVSSPPKYKSPPKYIRISSHFDILIHLDF